MIENSFYKRFTFEKVAGMVLSWCGQSGSKLPNSIADFVIKGPSGKISPCFISTRHQNLLSPKRDKH